ncbi:17644_t:CDS:2, partial [Racocetra persica]
NPVLDSREHSWLSRRADVRGPDRKKARIVENVTSKVAEDVLKKTKKQNDEDSKKIVSKKNCQAITPSPNSVSESVETIYDSELVEIEQGEEEIQRLSKDEVDIHNKLLEILDTQQKEDRKSGKDCLSSISLNHIINLSNDKVLKKVTNTLNEIQTKWLNMDTPGCSRYWMLTTLDTKKHKVDKVFKIIKMTQKNQAFIIVEFSYGRRALLAKENGDQIKLCQNSMRILNRLLENVSKDKAHVYLIQAVNGYIIIKYLIRPLVSIYFLQRSKYIKIPVSFDNFEQFAIDIGYLMNFQTDVLSTIKKINKMLTGDNILYITPVQDTPAKKKENQTFSSSPKSPCPRSPSQTFDLFSYL